LDNPSIITKYYLEILGIKINKEQFLFNERFNLN
jgi:hypothetical protein